MLVLALFLALVALVMINVPIAIAIGIVAVVGGVLINGTDDLLNVAITMYEGTRSFPLLAVPLFTDGGC